MKQIKLFAAIFFLLMPGLPIAEYPYSALAYCKAQASSDTMQNFEVLDIDMGEISVVDKDNLWAIANEERRVTSDFQKLYLNNQGTILHSSDGGRSWNKSLVKPAVYFYQIHFLSSKEGWVTGSSGLILHTRDGGKTWVKRDTPTRGLLIDVDFIDSDSGWIIGIKGDILSTRDGGFNWELHKIKGGEDLIDISFGDRQNGWVFGRKGKAYKSSDGGKSWQYISQELIVEPLGDWRMDELNFIGAKFFNSLVGFIAVDVTTKRTGVTAPRGVLLKTEDGGLSWVAVLTTGITGIRSVYFLNERELWVDSGGRYSYQLLHTWDGGGNWRSISIPENISARGIYFADSKHGWLIKADHQYAHFIYSTADGGKSWAKANLKDTLIYR